MGITKDEQQRLKSEFIAASNYVQSKTGIAFRVQG